MVKKRVHELSEALGYDKDYKILLDKSSDSESKQMSLRSFMDLLIKYNNTSEPIIVSTNISNKITRGSNLRINPHILGIELSYRLEGNPNFMQITSEGIIEIDATSVGSYNNIKLYVSNIFGETSVSINFEVIEPLYLSEKIVEVISPKNYLDSGKIIGLKSGEAIFDYYISKPIYYNEGDSGSLYFDGNEMTLLSLNELKLSNHLFKGILINFKPEMVRPHGPLIGSFNDGHTIDLIRHKGKNTISFDGNSRKKARCTFNGIDYTDYVRNNNINEYTNNSWNTLYVEFEHLQLLGDLTIGSNYPKFAIGSKQYKGLIGDIIIFGSTLTEDEVKNYIEIMRNKYE